MNTELDLDKNIHPRSPIRLLRTNMHQSTCVFQVHPVELAGRLSPGQPGPRQVLLSPQLPPQRHRSLPGGLCAHVISGSSGQVKQQWPGEAAVAR